MSRTHPIPNKSQQTLEGFRQDLKLALKAFLPTNERPYSKVIVMLVSWDNAPEYLEELGALEAVFQNIYHYATKRCPLPAMALNNRAQATLAHHITEVTREYDHGTLIIFYYAGHATHEYDKYRPGLEHPCIIQ